jgi:hypothetical protein
MDEYISKQDAVEAVEFGITLASAINIETGEWTELFQRENDELREAVKRIKDIEPADVVQVVRCDDCVYYGSRRWCELHSSVFDDNAFCSYGEKKG